MASRPPMKNASRERRKAERLALAALVERLEQELAARRNAQTATSEWRRRADNEIRKRRLAECTNHQLHEALHRQEKTLAQLVQRLSSQASGSVAVPSRCLHDAQGRRFAMLLDEVERAYVSDLRVLMASAASSERFFPRLVEYKGERVLQARRATTLTYELPRCCEALWTASDQIARATHAETHTWVSRPTPDVVMMRLHASETHGDEATTTAWVATSSFVQKQFYAGGRMAVVWRSVTSIDNRDELADVYVDETGWTLVASVDENEHEREDKHDAPDPEREDDRVRIIDCVHTVPRSTRLEEAGNDASVAAPVLQFTRHVMAATTAHLDAIRDRMENLLIDDCMREVE